MANYGFEHAGKVYGPDGLIDRGDGTDTVTHNRNIEREEIAWLHTAPDRVFLYVTMPARKTLGAVSWAAGDYTASCCAVAIKMHGMVCPVCHKLCSETAGRGVSIHTWLGTSVATHVYIGRSVPVGGIAGRYATKRAVDCRIFGVRYVGWFWESAGSYCRLRKAKQQPKPRV